MNTKIRKEETDAMKLKEAAGSDLDLDALQDELEFQEFHWGLFAEY